MEQTVEEAMERVEGGRREFALQLWRHIPATGEPIGNASLRKLTKTKSAPGYWDARDAMRRVGLIELGRGRGGSVRRAEQYVDVHASAADEAPTGLEVRLYVGIKARLEEIIRDEGRFDDQILETTGTQGRRQTGGRWSRPDLTLVGLRRFDVLAGAHLEVQTFEVKTADGFDLVALHEARAHRRRAHRSYVVVDLEDADDEERIGDLVDEARDLGVGLISFVETNGEWKYWHDPDLTLPDPVELDSFLSNQLSVGAKDKIRGWRALPALGGAE